jgi:acetate kinase
VSNIVLALNAGSSSLKFAAYDALDLTPLCRGAIEAIGATDAAARFCVRGRLAPLLTSGAGLPRNVGHEAATRWLIDAISLGFERFTIVAAGHRVVHGGAEFYAPIRVTGDVLDRLAALTPLAPAHQPHNLAPIRALWAARPELTQTVCFDTAFHRTQPRLAQIFPLPRSFADRGILRYGFHGLSYQFIAKKLCKIAPERAQGRVIAAHLGHGASLCAMQNLESIATTMGFTALDGLMMGSRSGAIDPGLVLHLIQQEGLSARTVSKILYEEAGLLGVSGISDDLKVLEASGDPAALEAMELFAYRAAREAASLTASLKGLDILVFTGGIGENSAKMRACICDYLVYLGIMLDEPANSRNDLMIGAPNAPVDVFVIPADEEIVIAEAARDLWRKDMA